MGEADGGLVGVDGDLLLKKGCFGNLDVLIFFGEIILVEIFCLFDSYLFCEDSTAIERLL